MVNILTNAGGTKTPSSLPKLDENPDPLFSDPPPWLSQNCNGIIEKALVKDSCPKESFYGSLKKGLVHKPDKQIW